MRFTFPRSLRRKAILAASDFNINSSSTQYRACSVRQYQINYNAKTYETINIMRRLGCPKASPLQTVKAGVRCSLTPAYHYSPVLTFISVLARKLFIVALKSACPNALAILISANSCLALSLSVITPSVTESKLITD